MAVNLSNDSFIYLSKEFFVIPQLDVFQNSIEHMTARFSLSNNARRNASHRIVQPYAGTPCQPYSWCVPVLKDLEAASNVFLTGAAQFIRRFTRSYRALWV